MISFIPAVCVFGVMVPVIYINTALKTKMNASREGGDIKEGEMRSAMKSATWITVLIGAFYCTCLFVMPHIANWATKKTLEYIGHIKY